MADTFGMVLKGIILVVVIMVLTTIAAQDFKDLTFAEDEWEDLTDSLGAFNAETVIDPLEGPGPLDPPGEGGRSNCPPPPRAFGVPEPCPGRDEDTGKIVPDWLRGIPVIGEIAVATVAVAQAIGMGVLAFVDFVQKGVDSLLALGRFLFAIATFDIPALNAHPVLIMIRFIIVLPLWVGIPYLFVRMIRGGG